MRALRCLLPPRCRRCEAQALGNQRIPASAPQPAPMLPAPCRPGSNVEVSVVESQRWALGYEAGFRIVNK